MLLFLHHVLGDGIYSRSLGTKDLTEALRFSIEHSARFERLLGEATPSRLYEAALAELRNPGRDLDADYDPEVEDLLSAASDDDKEDVWYSLTEWQRARYRASKSVFGNRPRPIEYAYSLRACLADYQAHKEGEIEQKTLSRCAVSVDSYLGNRRDTAMPLHPFDTSNRIAD